jgi:hypothetical protein
MTDRPQRPAPPYLVSLFGPTASPACRPLGYRSSTVFHGFVRVVRPVLDAGVGSVPGLQEGHLSAASVGGEGLVAVAVVLLEQRQLGYRMRAAPASSTTPEPSAVTDNP